MRNAELENAATGRVRYQWPADEPVNAAEQDGMTEPVVVRVVFEIEGAGVGRITVPTSGEDALIVVPRGP